MKNNLELTLSELRELYPEIKATSKVRFLELVNEIEVSDIEVVEEVLMPDEIKDYVEAEFSGDEIEEGKLLEYIASQIMTRNKILIKCEDSTTADDYFLQCQYGLFPKLNDKGISVLASSTRRDMSLNGTCYVRLVCAKTHAHLKQLMVYNVFKTIVK